MHLYEMKHHCAEHIIELKEIRRGDKNAHFQEQEPIRLTKIGKNILLASMNDDQKTVSAQPINAHMESIINRIDGSGMPKLIEVIEHKNREIMLMVRVFNEEKMLDYAINITDDFLKKLKISAQLKNVNTPKKDIEHNTLFRCGEYSYALIGIHIHAKEKQKFNHFVIAGVNYYVHVKKQIDEYEHEYYIADKVTKKISDTEYKFFLAKGHLRYTEEAERVREETLTIMESLSDNTYIKIWDKYGELERQMIIDKARELQSIRYVSFEAEGSKCRFDIKAGNENKLEKFKAEFNKGDLLAALPINPFERPMENEEFSRFLYDNREYMVTLKLAEEIDTQAGYLYFYVEDDKLPILAKAENGYIFMSIQGDEKRLRRREVARTKIENATCPMPNLSAVLEGRSITNPKKRNLPAMSEKVKKEIFTDKKGNYRPPTVNQEEAIAIALNTPDIALIQGPPGTGKTTVITAILKRLNEEMDTTEGIFGKNLVTAFQHDAVQNAIDRIEILGLPAIKFGRKYSEVEDEYTDVNSSVQNWINEKLVDLNIKHVNTLNKKYMVEYNKIMNNYMYSSNSVEQAIRILEEVRDLVGDELSLELLEELNKEIRNLSYMTRGKSDAELISLIRAVRRIPISKTAFEDDGRFELGIAIRLLKQQNNEIFVEDINKLEAMQTSVEYDFALMKEIRKRILVQILPKEKVFTDRVEKRQITILLSRISEYLLGQIEGGKYGEELVILQYIQGLEENPLAVKQAILNYSAVNGATNQQVMRKEISELKGGDIIYDNVLVDEAARSNPLDLFIPMSIAKDRIILVGDHRQLPHIVDEAIVQELEKSAAGDIGEEVKSKIKESMFEQLFTRLKMLEAADGIKRTITLDKQYRMHPTLGKFVNDNFYEKYSESEHVGNGIEDAKMFAHSLPGIENKACIWYDVPLEKGREKVGKSKSRKIEAQKIAEHLKEMLQSQKGKDYSYGIITFYREQVNVINEQLKEVGIYTQDEAGNYTMSVEYRNNEYIGKEYIKVGTVDAFQGMEFDVVYLSMVRSNDMQVQGDKKEIEKAMQKKFGFLMYENRLCVAMSRQKKALICVGDSTMLIGNHAEEAIPSLISYYRLCKEDQYGEIL